MSPTAAATSPASSAAGAAPRRIVPTCCCRACAATASPPPSRPPDGAIGRWSSGTNSGTKEPHADSIAPAQLAGIRRRPIVALDRDHPEQPVWIFGYGSLIWDGWESKSERRCLRAARAELPGWRRVFNKKSVLNWGTRAAPCPTLNLEQAPAASCRGLAFEFANDARFLGEMLLYLRRREACEPCELPIRIDGVGAARALVYLYRGANLIAERL